MIRLLLSLVVLTLLITYVIIPLVKPLKKIFKKESERIDRSLIDNKIEKDDLK